MRLTAVLLLLLCICHAYAFALDAALVASVDNPIPESGAHFGASLSASGAPGYFLAGAPDAASSHGRVMVYANGNLELIRTVTNDWNATSIPAHFGASITPRADGFLAGSPDADGHGVVDAFDGDGSQHVVRFMPFGISVRSFGAGVAASASNVYVGYPDGPKGTGP